MARADGGQILVDDGLGGPAPLGLVAQQAADEPDVGRGVDEHPDVEQVDQRRRAQQVGALDDHHLGRPHRLAARLAPVVDEGIERSHDVAPGLQFRQVADHQLVVAGRHVVEVEGGGVEAGQAGGVAVVGILAHQHGRAGGQGGDQRLREGALAGAGAPGDGDENGHGGLDRRHGENAPAPRTQADLASRCLLLIEPIA